MALPFQYDNFVQSQIAMGNTNSNIQYGSRINRNDNQRQGIDNTTNIQNRVSLKNKIN
jgi:hypothetical protein